MLHSTPNFAIVVCTYNPEAAVFSRTLSAIAALEIPAGTGIECVIVDNNSSTPLTDLPYVASFLEQCQWAKVVNEPEQGLTFARIAGIQATIAPTLIFIDDDNEPATTYLKSVQQCLETYPAVAVWGPGKINVEFLEPVSDWFDQNFRKKFQERNCQYTEFGCVLARWADFYPFGTGLVVKREVVERYRQSIAAGILSATDRQGKSLSSAGDIQIVWEAAKMGLAAGVSPDLQVTHVIPEKRSNLNYVKRLTFGTASSYMPALTHSFASEKAKVANYIPSNRTIFKRITDLILRRAVRFKYKLLLVDLAKYTGQVVGTLRAVDPSEPHWIYGLVRLLQLE